ncbi:hypothetical protein WCD74_29780 [Actinomycetospora sp. OC33-EN08]|uniref:Tetratricopeptide repeat protein n=1 Tax=Actinomycetospora aurantiaca TaxID=3129233 RepID=A0ABU8MXC1_9PSEU
MAARRENGAPSARAVLEVADGLRWTDPALGASLAEHARRLAGDDPIARAAADRSIIRSLAESDRYEDVVARAVPLIGEARSRGDRDDGAAVVIELAHAAVGLGDADLARRLLDRVEPTDDLPARVVAGLWTVRAEACAAAADVVGTDRAVEAATSVLLRVPAPESDVLRSRMALARGIARRRAGDVSGALGALTEAISVGPTDDVDGGRRSMLSAAEVTELLVETGRPDDAAARARSVLPDGPADPQWTCAVARIRLAVAADDRAGASGARAAAEELEAGGRLSEAARAWETVATVAEGRGDLGEALTALRHGHDLGTRARDGRDAALRALAALEASELLAPISTRTPDEPAPPVPPRRRRHHRADDAPTPDPVAAGPAPRPADDVPGPSAAVPSPVGDDGPDGGPHRGDPLGVRAELPVEPSLEHTVEPTVEPAVGPGSAGEPARSARDELADLLASLTRSVDSSLAGGPEPAPEPLPDATRGDASEVGDRGTPEPPSEPVRRSRHSAPSLPDDGSATSRPTFDAFGTAPTGRHPVTPPVPADPLPDDRFGPTAPTVEPADDERDGPGARSLSSLLADDGPAERPESPPISTQAPPFEPTPTPETARTSPADGTDDVVRVPSSDPLDPGWSHDPFDLPATFPGESPASGSTDRVVEHDQQDARSAQPEDLRPTELAAEESTRGRGEDAGAPATPRRAEPAPDRRPPRPLPASNAPDPAPTPASPTPATDGYDEELGLTLASVLAEYHLPDVPVPPRRERGRPAARSRPDDRSSANGTRPPSPAPGSPASPPEVAVPSARRHTSGSMPVPGEQERRDPRANGTGPGTPEPTAAPGGRGRPPESGAKLADLLAEAMDAFRHVGPAGQDGARPPGVGSRRG